MSMIGNFRLASDKQIAAFHERPNTIDVFLRGGDDDEPTVTHRSGDELDIGKSWDALNFLLAPLRFICEGGREIGDVDVGHGPARSFTSAEVSSLASALATLDEAKLRARFKPAAMGHLYPRGTWDETFDWLYGEFERLRAFVGSAAAKKSGIIVYLS